PARLSMLTGAASAASGEVVEPVRPGCSSAAEVHAAAAPDLADPGELETEPSAQSPDRGLSPGRGGEEQLVVLPTARGRPGPRPPIGIRGNERARDGEQAAVEIERDA